MRNFWKGFFTAYLLSALIVGNAMGAIIPALNPLGRVWAGIGWPITSTCIAIHRDCDGLPPLFLQQYMFKEPIP